MGGKPIVATVLRWFDGLAMGGLADDAKCDMAQIYGRERMDYRCWLGGELLFFLGDFSCYGERQWRES